jgi:hypothetical protein
MKRADDIERVFQRAGLGIGPDADERVFEDMLQARRQTTENPTTVFDRWRTIMRSPLTKVAVAAVVIIACLIGLSLWRTTGSGIALADVLARMEQVKAFRSQWSMKVTGEDPNKPYSFEKRGTMLISQEYGRKGKIEQPNPNGGESTFVELYRLPDKKTLIVITPKEKKYWRYEVDDESTERIWQEMNDPRTFLEKIVACKHESLGRSTIDAIEVEGFQTTDPNWSGLRKVEVDAKIWVDVKTRLPVRYDFTTAYFDRMGDKISHREHFVMHDFQWDVPVEAAEFKPVIPDDYTGTVVKYPAHITEETAIQGLKVWVELLGKYPAENINDVDGYETVVRLAEKSETPAAMRLKEEIKGLTDEQINNKLVDFLIPIRGLAMFYDRLVDDGKHARYYGKTVTPKDADKVLMRWKVSDKEYRVIFGDLHAQTVTAEKLAELEKALPK